MSFTPQQIVAASSISFSFILVGNAITQSFMGVPALLVDFPSPGSEGYPARAQLLGRQWPTFWKVGNNFFRPISTLGMLGYAFVSYSAFTATSWTSTLNLNGRADWRLFALSALCHLANIVHSAVNMQPLNDKLEALSGSRTEGKGAEAGEGQGGESAVELGQKWITGNYLRIGCPLLAAVLAMAQIIGPG